MAAPAFMKVSEIDLKTRRRSAVVVRILHRWNQKERYGKEGVELILVGEEGDLIQASVPPSLKAKFADQLNEGELKTITNFFVEENTPPQKAKINHSYKMIVKIATTISDYELTSSITRYEFKFIPFVDIPSKDATYAVDVLGIIVTYRPIEVVDMLGGAKKCEVILADSDGQEMVCALWESYIDDWEMFAQVHEFLPNSPVWINNEPVMLAAQFTMIKSYMGNTFVQTMKQASKIHINPEIQEVKDYICRRGLSVSSNSLSMTPTSTGGNLINHDDWLVKSSVRTIEGLLSATEVGVYTLKAQIGDIDTGKLWYYDACGNLKCNRKVAPGKKVGDMCPNCNTFLTMIIPRLPRQK